MGLRKKNIKKPCAILFLHERWNFSPKIKAQYLIKVVKELSISVLDLIDNYIFDQFRIVHSAGTILF